MVFLNYHSPRNFYKLILCRFFFCNVFCNFYGNSLRPPIFSVTLMRSSGSRVDWKIFFVIFTKLIPRKKFFCIAKILVLMVSKQRILITQSPTKIGGLTHTDWLQPPWNLYDLLNNSPLVYPHPTSSQIQTMVWVSLPRSLDCGLSFSFLWQIQSLGWSEFCSETLSFGLSSSRDVRNTGVGIDKWALT